jgi:hypothetical protein
VLRQGDRGLPAEVQADDFLLGQRERAHAFKLANIRRATSRYTGKVYNLEVAGSPTFVAGGFLVHNCRCVVTAWHKSWAEMARKEEPEEPPEARAIAV